MTTDEADFLSDFVAEAAEFLDQAETRLITLDREMRHRTLLDEILCALHGTKSASKFLGSARLESLMHAAESLVSGMREGETRVTPTLIAALLAVVDGGRRVLEGLSTGVQTDVDCEALINMLSRHEAQAHAPSVEGTAAVIDTGDALPEPRLGDLLVREGRTSAEAVAAAVQRQVDGDPRRLGEILVDDGVVTQQDVTEMLALQAGTTSLPMRPTRVSIPESLLNDLDQQVAVVLDLARRQARCDADANPQALEQAAERTQALLRQVRLQPVRTLWNRFPRFVRDLAAELHKDVRLEMDNPDVEIERDVLEMLKAPLAHLLRNAIDHGIETPAVRHERGKNTPGVIRLRAVPRPEEVVVEVSDDGAGIDPQAMVARALARGLISEAQAATLDADRALRLAFLPGLSLAPAVSQVSGRGVGLDLVLTRIESLGAEVEVHSTPHHGTLFRIRVPRALTLPARPQAKASRST